MTTTDILVQIHCDKCGKTMHNHKGGHWFKTKDEAEKTVLQYGWRHVNGTDKHICYQCYRQMRHNR